MPRAAASTELAVTGRDLSPGPPQLPSRGPRRRAAARVRPAFAPGPWRGPLPSVRDAGPAASVPLSVPRAPRSERHRSVGDPAADPSETGNYVKSPAHTAYAPAARTPGSHAAVRTAESCGRSTGRFPTRPGCRRAATRRPEESVPYRLLHARLETFLAEARANGARHRYWGHRHWGRRHWGRLPWAGRQCESTVAVTISAIHNAPEAQSLGVAVVGAGYWGPNLARNFAAATGFELRWVCDVVAPRARVSSAVHAGARAAATLAVVLADPGVAAVAIATPAATHAHLVRACLEAGRHVLVEKPLACSLAEAEGLVGLARQRGLVLLCDQTYCFAPAAQRLRVLCREGALGELRHVDSVRVNRGQVRPDIDVFWDLAHHDIALLEFLLAPDDGVVAVAARGADPLGVGHSCLGTLTLYLRHGAQAHVRVSWVHPTKQRTVIVAGSRRTLVWDDLAAGPGLRMHAGIEAGADGQGDAGSTPLALPIGEPLAAVVDVFGAVIRGTCAPPIGLDAELRVLATLEAASASLAHAGAVVQVAARRTGLA